MLKDLAREYAALVPDWAKPGMRCVDPVTGAAWRLLAYEAHGWNFDNRRAELLVDGDDPDDMLIRALAAGPDLEDAATVGGLLGASGQVHLRAGWWVANVNGFCAQHQDRAEAIIRACIAQAKGN